jgi:GAF domain-containing protein
MTGHSSSLRLSNSPFQAIEHLGSEDLRTELDAELAGAYWIYEISGRLFGKSSVPEVLNEILDGAIALTDADFGNIQLLDAGVLRIVAQRNLPPAFLEFFRDVTDDTTATCSAALQCCSRVIVEDVESDELFRGSLSRDILLDAGVREVLSTPLTGSSGELYGMLSTQFRRVGWPP